MTTQCTDLGLNEPVRFLKSTVLSFNCSLGLGSTSESSINVDLVDDCDPAVESIAGNFQPVNDSSVIVGAPVYFPDNPQVMPQGFSFGGILSSWTIQQSASGKTYNVKIVDPRQLLENTVIIVDSYLGKPQKSTNYFNAYAYYEQTVLDGDCSAFGSSGSTERGMPIVKILQALNNMGTNICSPTGYIFKVDITTFPGFGSNTRSLPEWYRVAGPGISILELLQQICDALAYDFYVELKLINGQNVIQVGTIDLNNPPTSFSYIYNAYKDISTDISYGQELRNEKSKSIIFGEKVHYLTIVKDFDFFFGEDLRNGVFVPVVPYKYDTCGFWILKDILSLDVTLDDPIGGGPYQISELDIRCAMSSYEMWKTRTFDANTPGSFNQALRAKYPEIVGDMKKAIETLENVSGALIETARTAGALVDSQQNPNPQNVEANRPEVVNELKKIHGFLNNLGNTYYGKQFIAALPQKICYIDDIDGENTPRHYSDLPTNAGGWLDFGLEILSLSDPDLDFFRSDDNRINSFAVFATDNDGVSIEDPEESSDNSEFYNSEDSSPE